MLLLLLLLVFAEEDGEKKILLGSHKTKDFSEDSISFEE